MQVVVLAAGLSTRLRPLTDSVPKPMLPVGGRPMLEHLVAQLVSNGFSEIFITTHYCADVIRDHFGDGSAFGAHIRYAHEDTLMNTAGSLKLLKPLLREDFLVVGGNDLLPTIDLNEFARYHNSHDGIGTIAFKRVDDPSLLPLFGQGLLDPSGRLITFEEKPVRNVSDLVHTTYQIYHHRVLDYVPAGLSCSIPEYLIRHVLAAGEKIHGYVTESPFICISTPELYERAQNQLNP